VSLQKQYSGEYFQRQVVVDEAKSDDNATEETKLSSDCLSHAKELGEAYISFITQCYDDMSSETFDDTKSISAAAKVCLFF
jgi:hypothetical protein